MGSDALFSMKKQKSIPFRSGISSCVFLFAILFVTLLPAQNADIRLLRSINHPALPNWDKTMRFTSNSVAPMMVALPVGMLVYNLAAKKDKPFLGPLVVAGTLGLNTVFTIGLKKAVNRPRPFVTYNDIEQRDQHVGPYSFPSGHTSSAFAMATAFSFAYPKWYVIAPSFAYAGLVAYSRMRLGVHYPSDVLAGAMIGTICGLVGWQANRYLIR
jgi:membrane-associated phospholipid phosphatase